MSDLESFIPSEESEGFDPAAFERFKENVKKGAAADAKAKKQEGKQKKKEDKLVQILLRFIKDQKKKGVLFLIARLLEENIPPLFVLSIVTLGMEDVRNEIAAVRAEEHKELTEAGKLQPPDDQEALEMKLALPDSFANIALPLEIKGEVDAWIKGIFDAGSANAPLVLERGLTDKGAIKQVLIDCSANVMSDYFEEREGLPSMAYDGYYNFCALVMKKLFTQLKKQVQDQKQLAETGERNIDS
ncbi:hypothetical protein COV82_01950 [Candidatus Peregrinibacteria bacterium CG11_big_fil_rev_8_21_14_0_20_46_8]|nr:MAG: hypothetical protein COV82_01950 [Candidatus Peregrinibacteria bacterium CG11_big_fil_rev_8_21_14_0_20_46_8]